MEFEKNLNIQYWNSNIEYFDIQYVAEISLKWILNIWIF